MEEIVWTYFPVDLEMRDKKTEAFDFGFLKVMIEITQP